MEEIEKLNYPNLVNEEITIRNLRIKLCIFIKKHFKQYKLERIADHDKFHKTLKELNKEIKDFRIINMINIFMITLWCTSPYYGVSVNALKFSNFVGRGGFTAGKVHEYANDYISIFLKHDKRLLIQKMAQTK